MEDGKLRKVGGSVMLSVPPAILKELALEAGSPVALSVTADGAILVNPKQPRKLSLRQLLAEDRKVKARPHDKAWVGGPRVGREIL